MAENSDWTIPKNRIAYKRKLHIGFKNSPIENKYDELFTGEHNRQELQDFLGLSDRKKFRENYLNPAIEAGLVELVDPSNPTSSKQRYVLKTLGKRFAEKIDKQ